MLSSLLKYYFLTSQSRHLMKNSMQDTTSVVGKSKIPLFTPKTAAGIGRICSTAYFRSVFIPPKGVGGKADYSI